MLTLGSNTNRITLILLLITTNPFSSGYSNSDSLKNRVFLLDSQSLNILNRMDRKVSLIGAKSEIIKAQTRIMDSLLHIGDYEEKVVKRIYVWKKPITRRIPNIDITYKPLLFKPEGIILSKKPVYVHNNKVREKIKLWFRSITK